MKRYLILLMTLVCYLGMNAEVRSISEMTAAATRVLQRPGLLRAHKTGVTPVSIKPLATYGQMTAIGYDDGGFALVSHDKALPEVLLYCDTRYDELPLCPALQEHIQAMADYLDHCAEAGIQPVFLASDVTLGHPEGVPEILTCRWNQYAPYNYLCPMLYQDGDESRAITGCVSTAMSQVVYNLYRKLGVRPELHGAKRYHFFGDKGQRVNTYLYFPSLDFNWDDLCDTYKGTEPYAQSMAVASLMYACGMSVSTSYSTGGSGAQFSFIPDGIKQFFGGIEATYYASLADNHQLVYDELDAGRPVLFGGERPDMGAHAFVGDGYDKDGLVHINLGWGGGSNCFSALTDLWGFSSNQNLCTFKPSSREFRFSEAEPIDELRDLYATADINAPATSIEEGRWYVLYNMGRCTSIYTAATGKVPNNVKYIPAADATDRIASMLVRFQKKEDNMYYIQSGTGDYFGGLTYNGAQGSSRNASNYYLTGHIGDADSPYFWMKESGITLDCNWDGGGIFGWKSDTPTDILATNSWQLYPVTLTEDAQVAFAPDSLDFSPDRTYTMQCYDGNRNYGFMLKNTCTTSGSNRTPLHILRGETGWTICNAEDEEQVMSVKAKDFKTGNGASASDKPLVFYFEPTDIVPDTDDPDLNATSKIYRIRCEAGYLALQKAGLGSSVYCNLGPQSTYGLWLITDRTAYNEIHPDGIRKLANEEISKLANGGHFDLQGRPARKDTKGVTISEGMKVVKK